MCMGEEILQSPNACVRTIFALKAGRAPKEGIEFLSVGADDTIACIESALRKASRSASKPLWLIGNYGDGKSHTLRLLATIAERERFGWVYITHDARENVGLHKPAWMLRRILRGIKWSYPQLDLGWHEWRLNYRPSYHDDYPLRTSLPSRLSELAALFRKQKYRGIVLFIDEVEDCCNFWWNQHRPAYETLSSLVRNSERYCLICFGMTPSGLGWLQRLWSTYVNTQASKLLQDAAKNTIPLPQFDDRYLLDLAERISRVHAVAFDWTPNVRPAQIVEKIKEQYPNLAHWRTAVQSIVTELEIAHQSIYRYVSQPVYGLSTLSTGSLPEASVPLRKPASVPTPKSVRIGDLVEITTGILRGWKGTVRNLNGNIVEVEITLRGGMRMVQRVLSDGVKRVRK